MSTGEGFVRDGVEGVFAFIYELVEALPVPSGYKELLRVHLEVSRGKAGMSPERAATRLPLLVHAAIAGDEGPALPVAAACTLLHLGGDLFDSAVDDELPIPWRERDPAEINLAATTLLGVLPQLALARLEDQGTPPATTLALTRLFANTLLKMGAGQHEDLRLSCSEDVSLKEIQAMVERKSGSEIALSARAGALVATRDRRKIGSYAGFGLCCGVAKQLINDLWDIWGATVSRDLLNGRRTLPIAHALATSNTGQRDRLNKLLAAAVESPECHDRVREALVEAGSVSYTMLMVRLYRERALNHLAIASSLEPAGRKLREVLDHISLLPRPTVAQPPPTGRNVQHAVKLPLSDLQARGA